MDKLINVLIIDDHPIIVNAYKNSIAQYKKGNSEYKFKIDVAFCCENAANYLFNKESKLYNIVILDIRLPPSTNKSLFSGEDIGFKIKKNLPETKLIIITGYNDTIILSNILQNINPDSLLLKGDIVQDTIHKALDAILKEIPYYSESILRLLRKKISSKIMLDTTDKKLLYELSKGIKTKDLTKVLPLSIGGIEKRKRYLKEIFGTTKKGDEELITSAKEIGFI